MIVMYTL